MSIVYIDKALTAQMMPEIKSVATKYKSKVSVATRYHNSLWVIVKESPFDLLGQWLSWLPAAKQSAWSDVLINHNCLDQYFNGEALAFLEELRVACMKGNIGRAQHETYYLVMRLGTTKDPFVHTK